MICVLISLLLGRPVLGEIAYMQEGKVWLVREDGSGMRKLADASYDRPLLWSPDGQKLLYWKEDPTWQLFQVEPDSGKIVNLTQNRAEDCRAANFSRDGRQIAFLSGERGLCLIKSDGRDLQNLSTKGHRDARPYWTAAGDLLFQDISGGKFAVLRYAPKTGLVSEVADATAFSVSPPGSTLALLPRGAERPDLEIRDLESEKVLAQFRDGRKYEDLVWSRDGRSVYAKSYAPSSAIWNLSIRGESRKVVDVRFDAWVGFDESLNGESVVFSNGRRPDEAIWVVPKSGGTPRRIASGVWPAWRPIRGLLLAEGARAEATRSIPELSNERRTRHQVP